MTCPTGYLLSMPSPSSYCQRWCKRLPQPGVPFCSCWCGHMVGGRRPAQTGVWRSISTQYGRSLAFVCVFPLLWLSVLSLPVGLGRGWRRLTDARKQALALMGQVSDVGILAGRPAPIQLPAYAVEAQPVYLPQSDNCQVLLLGQRIWAVGFRAEFGFLRPKLRFIEGYPRRALPCNPLSPRP